VSLARLLEEAVRFQTRFLSRMDPEIREGIEKRWQAVEDEVKRMAVPAVSLRLEEQRRGPGRPAKRA